MNNSEAIKLLEIGKGVNVEFKRCSHQPERDTFETVCSFANTFGGTILLGVEDDASITGIAPESSLDIHRNLINVIHNPNAFDTPVAFEAEEIQLEGKTILRLWIPPSPSLHRFKGEVYERIDDVDTAVRSTARLAELCIRKQNIYTEQRVYPYVAIGDLREDLISEARIRAANKHRDHPWARMSDEDLLKSAGLFGRDYTTREEGFNLAAILLLGKDDVIRSICPSYKTDALWQVDPATRYDDRLTSRTNLIQAYEELTGFCRKHMPDRFDMNGDFAVSLRDSIIRETVTNCLIHREFTSPYPAHITIDLRTFTTENASRAMFSGTITPATALPMPKNPLIASFFTTIGLAEELGSGTRHLFDEVPRYSGQEPTLTEGTVFKARIPIYQPAQPEPLSQPENPSHEGTTATRRILQLAETHGTITVSDATASGIPRRTAQRILANLTKSGLLLAEGTGRARRYHTVTTPDLHDANPPIHN